MIDGFYEWQCGNCGQIGGSRECGWPIAGLVCMCSGCKKRNLLLRTDVNFINETLSKSNIVSLKNRLSNAETEIEKLRDKVEFYKQPCPEDRKDDTIGYSQGEARFWHETAEKLGDMLDRIKEIGNETIRK